MSGSFAADRRLILLDVIWLALLGLNPGWHGSNVAFFTTVVLIQCNAVAFLWTLTQERRVLILLNIPQVVLFGVLSYQLSCSDADHFQFDGDPGLADWAEFVAVHVCRAADALDALDEYGLTPLRIRHNSVTSGLILVCMHVLVNVFLIGLLFRWLGHWLPARRETILVRGRRRMSLLFVGLGAYAGVGLWHTFRGWDWLLWPLENVLRVLDIGDLFQVFDWHLYELEREVWTSSLTVLFRLAVAVSVAQLILWLRFFLLQGWGLSLDELIEKLTDADAFVRREAARALACCGPRAAPAVPHLIEALSDYDLEVCCAAAEVLGRIGPRAWAAVPALAQSLWNAHQPLRLAAARSLARLGPAAKHSLPDLHFLLRLAEEPLRGVVLEAIQTIRKGTAPVPRHVSRAPDMCSRS